MPIDYSKWAALDCSDSDEESAPKVQPSQPSVASQHPDTRLACFDRNSLKSRSHPHPRRCSSLLLPSFPRRKTPRGVIGMHQTIIGR